MSDKKTEIERIAREVLRVQTLESQGRDYLDFHDLAVWNIQKALEAAYDAGQQAPRTRRRKTTTQ
jgi:hypothetical protein